MPRGHDRRAMARAGQNLFKAGGARVAFAQACPKARSRADRRVARSSNGRAMAQMKRSVVVRVGLHRLTTTDLIVVLGMVLVAVALGLGLHLQIGSPPGGRGRGAHRRGCAARRPCAGAPLGALRGEVARLQAELDVLNGLRGIAGEVPPARRTASAAPPAPPAGPRAREAADAAQPGSCREAAPGSLRRPSAARPRPRRFRSPWTSASDSGLAGRGPALKAPVRGAAAAGPPAEALQELWSFRPSSPPELSSGSARRNAGASITAGRPTSN